MDLGTGVADPGGGGEPEVNPSSFSWDTPLPGDLPDALSSLKGKTAKDLADSYSAARSKIGEQGTRINDLTTKNAELQAGLEAAKAAANGEADPATLAAAKAQADQMTQRYQEATKAYMETGEVDEEFVDAMAGTGVRVDRDTLLAFMEYQRFANNNMVATLAQHAGREDVTPEVVGDIVEWMRSGESPFSQDERKGFDAMMKRNNFNWFDTVLEAYEGGDGDQKPMNRRQTTKKKVRGRPILTPDQKGFGDTKDFQQALIDNRSDRTKTQVQRDKIERELIARRRAERGE
jgi:hypothetical protein